MGKSLVADPQVAKVVVTGSIAVCEQVKAVDQKLGREAKALTEGGAANFVIVFEQHAGMTRQAYLAFVAGAILKSMLPYGGQKYIGARWVVVHDAMVESVVKEARAQLVVFAQGWTVEIG